MSTSYLQDIQKSRSANIYGNGFTLSFRRQTAQSVIPSIFQDHHYGGSKAVARFLLDASLPICARDLRAVGNDPFAILFISRSELVPHHIPDNVIVTFNLQPGRPVTPWYSSNKMPALTAKIATVVHYISACPIQRRSASGPFMSAPKTTISNG
jgi:hypothetical protein